ncbi:MAG: protein translocase subunit SecD [Actinomycetota bacterium]|nr:protein translocase subunit SecD [Actinomycetota bacterium]
MAKKTSRPGRNLLIFAVSVAVLYALAALGQTWKPRLGLDLEGGTRITLVALGGAPSSTKMNQAAQIINARVNGSGVAEASVTTQGNRNIIVEIPGQNRKDLVQAVERTAQLRFRLIVGQPQAGVPLPASTLPGSPSGSATGTPSPTSSPTSTGSPTPKVKPGKTTGSATPKPRPAPAFAVKAASGSPSPSPSPSTANPTATPLTQPTAAPTGTPTGSPLTAKGAPVSDALAWSKNPGASWLQRYAKYNCPSPSKAAQRKPDDPNQPLITCDDKGSKFLLSKAVIEGTSLKDASYGIPPNSTTWAVNLTLKGGAPTHTFGDITTALYKNNGLFATVLDGQVISYAGVNQPILGGDAQITGSFTEAEAKSLANSLKFGALPVRFANPPTVQTIGPSLAGSQLSAGITAGIIGLLVVMLYCLLYYRGLGLVVISSLVVAALVTYATVLVLAKAAGFTLTLPGIAGLIVAVGITADSFIVFFERIRDEMRDGKSMRVAVEAGWLRARNTCLAADAVSLLAAVVLYTFAIGVVRGFAFALGISTIIDVAVFFWFTHPLMTLLAQRRFFNSGHRLSGLSPETLGMDSPGPGERHYAGGMA